MLWFQTKVFQGLDIPAEEAERFDEYMDRELGYEGRRLMKFINESPTESETICLFYKIRRRDDREVVVEYGN